MKRFKRTVAYVLAAVLSFSSFLQPVPVFAAEESAKVMEISGEQKTEETEPEEARRGKEGVSRS